MSFTLHEFARGFVAKLLADGTTSLRPNDPADIDRLKRVYDYLIHEAQSARSDEDWFGDLLGLRNEFAPSYLGTFDNFTGELRNLQRSLTACPNPYYEEISFSVSQPYAASLFNEFEPKKRQLIENAVQKFSEHVNA
jgi:hypothetical protein